MDRLVDVGNPAAVLSTDDLIAKLYALKAPSRDVDADIARYFGWTEKMFGGAGRVWKRPDSDHPTPVQPRYTGDVGVALTLLDGWWWSTSKGCLKPDEPLFAAYVYREGDVSGITVAEIEHDLLTVCIIIAALQARKTLS